jgi:hypothetical protein
MLKTILAIIIAAGIFSCSDTVKGNVLPNSDTIKGRVSVKGNEPHTYLALKTVKEEFKIVGLLTNEIRDKYQNKYIEVKGAIIKKAIGPGFPAELEVTSIVKVSSDPL